MRLFLTGNLIYIFTILTSIIVIIFELKIDYATISFTITYSMIVLGLFSEFINFWSMGEQMFVHVERIR